MLNGCSCTARPLVHNISTSHHRAAKDIFSGSSMESELEVVCGWHNEMMNEAYARQAAAKV